MKKPADDPTEPDSWNRETFLRHENLAARLIHHLGQTKKTAYDRIADEHARQLYWSGWRTEPQ
jgi:hypothetical protein